MHTYTATCSMSGEYVHKLRAACSLHERGAVFYFINDIL